MSSTTMKAGKSSTSMRQIGLHPEFFVLLHGHPLDAVVGQACGGATDRAEVEAAVPAAGLARPGHGAIALGQHHHAAAPWLWKRST